MSKNLMEVRDRFSKVLNDPAYLNASSREIASKFFKENRSTITQEAWNEVAISGLVQILGGLRKRRKRPPEGESGTLDLFAGFDIEPIVVVRVLEKGKGPIEKNKDTSSLTLSEATDYLNRHTKERASNTKRIREWRRLISRVRPFMTRPGMTLGEGLKLAEAAKPTKKKA